MRIASRFRLGVARLLLAPLVAGCGGEDGPALLPVDGVVTFDSKPLEQAKVSFIPDPGNKDVTPGIGVSGPDGKFAVQHSGRPGLALGRYKVLISKTDLAKPGVVIPKAFENDPLQQEFAGLRKETLPRKYSHSASATEVVEIVEGKTHFEFDLKKDAARKKK